ncbi:MICAL-like protein isoform X2 [Nomia melanderi]|uniref:MICAL-like protein isoform X2 n=1 Tax=Nomia melanderi TaxID=2448451 RepID=UPI00130464DF|nr:MICAL-like protein 1 isoform X2 [Nomia melanderi]
MGEKRGTKALELWCRRITDGYPGVNVQNMTTSWKDGLAFCAMIHHFRPDLIDFNSLDKNDVYQNNELAFRTAEQHLGIPALLDAEDMASCSVPDRLSILTYLSQFYQTFVGSSPSRPPVNRTTETEDERITQVSESPKQKVTPCLGMRRESCFVCGLPVFLAEKLVVTHLIYHRTCFRCARCNNQLTHGNYYETETGDFCCEACPDEGISSSVIQKYNDTLTFSTTLGGAEESDIVTDSSDRGSFSDTKETDQNIPSHNSVKRLQPEDAIIPETVAQTSRLRMNYISNHLLSMNSDEIVADDDTTDGESNVVEKRTTNSEADEATCTSETAFLVNDKFVEQEEAREESKNFCDTSLKVESQSAEETDRDSMKTDKEVQKLITSSFRAINKDNPSALVTKTSNIKESIDHIDEDEDTERCLSLVQQRLKLFETCDKEDRVKRREKKFQNIEAQTSKAQSNGRVELISKSQVDLKFDQEGTEEQKHLDEETKALNNNTIKCTDEKSIMLDIKSSNTLDSETIELINNEGSNSVSNVRNLSIEESEENVMRTPELSKNLDTINIDRESSEDHQVDSDSVKQSSQTSGQNTMSKDYPENLNPFKSDDEEGEDHHISVDSFKSSTASSNPFENEASEKEGISNEKKLSPPKPAKRNNLGNTPKQQLSPNIQAKRRLAAPQINLNPFWSDEDDHDSDLDYQWKTPEQMPIPKPRNIKSLYASNTSLTNSEFGGTPGVTSRKKQPAPLPPINKDARVPEPRSSPALEPRSGSAESHKSHQRTTPKARKTKPAPPPPMVTSTPHSTVVAPLPHEISPIIDSCNTVETQNSWEDKKLTKDEANRNKQSLTHISHGDTLDYHTPYTDKSTQGKWKRKKNPAPPCPIPHRRKIKVMSLKDVKLELDEIELQQQGLEKQGVRLEQLIRIKCETGLNNDVSDVSMRSDVEELVLELFALVNEKNELFRRQGELMLLRRQQRLEEEHGEVEYQIRCLMSQNESTKTDFDKQREEALIQRLVQIVEKRNEIIECLEMDRRREIEEDKSIHKHMGLLAAKTKNELPDNQMNDPCCSKTKKGKPKKKTNEKKCKKTSKKDIDKDIDETEMKCKRHNKRKWF